MAQEYKVGNEFFLRFNEVAGDAFIICEQTSEFSVSSEIITVLCKTTGKWPTILPGGTNSGSFSFTGAYLKDPANNNISAFELAKKIGEVKDVTWGGLNVGDDIVTAKVHITDIAITSNTNEAITFSATLTIADEPTIEKITPII